MKDKERIEIVRLKERTGGFHKYVDSALVYNPDPSSNHYINGKRLNFNQLAESDRFDKDFAVAEQRVRQQ